MAVVVMHGIGLTAVFVWLQPWVESGGCDLTGPGEHLGCVGVGSVCAQASCGLVHPVDLCRQAVAFPTALEPKTCMSMRYGPDVLCCNS
jgi:hypothetical protein